MMAQLFALATLAVGQDVFLEQRTELEASGHMHSCLKSCLKKDDSHFKNCQADGSTDCSKSKCCEVVTDTCFVKNAYWASCQPSCKPGSVDAYGEKWDCTALSPSGCHHLQSCVASCAGSLEAEGNATLAGEPTVTDAEPEVDPELDDDESPTHLAATSGVTADCTGGNKDVCKKSCKQSFKDNDYIEHVCEVLCDKNCPDAPAKKCPNKKGLGACVRKCKSTSNGDDHGSHCEKDGATSCLSSKCCKSPGDKCFTKNPYWAACIGECTPGKRNKVDNQIWHCKELKPKQVCDPYKYRSCVDNCVEQC